MVGKVDDVVWAGWEVGQSHIVYRVGRRGLMGWADLGCGFGGGMVRRVDLLAFAEGGDIGWDDWELE